MKTIGLLGGMSWESTALYYQIINETVKEKLGGLHSAKILLYSVDFAEIEEYQAKGEWEKSAAVLSEAAKNLEAAGADMLALCTNTMHKIAPQIVSRSKIPFIHIADTTAKVLQDQGITKVGLLGTKYTMTQNFYKQKLVDAGIDVIIPNKTDVECVNQVIYEELCLGIISEESKQKYLRIMDSLAKQGAQGVILGCTEIGLLIQQADTPLPVFDTTKIHATETALAALV